MKKKTIIIVAFAVILCAIIGIGVVVHNRPQNNNIVVETEIELMSEAVKNMGPGISIGNSLDATDVSWGGRSVKEFETGWLNPVISPVVIRNIVNTGFNTVRIPVTWNHHFDANGNIDSAWLNRVEEVVNYVLNTGAYCIINVHHDTGAEGWIRAELSNYNRNEELVKALWTNIATRFKDYSGKLIFEGFNEMLDDNAEWNNPSQDSLEAMNLYNQLFVDAVRATGGNNAIRNLIVNTYAASTTATNLNGFELPKDTAEGHLGVEFHCYDPWGFTGSNLSWVKDTDTFTDDIAVQIDEALRRVNNRFVKAGIPVIWGEFGCEAKANDSQRCEYVTYVASHATNYGIPVVYWDDGGKMQITSRFFNVSPHNSIAEAIIEASKK